MSESEKLNLPVPEQPENALSGNELHGLLFTLQNMQSAMNSLRQKFSNEDFVNRLWQMYNRNDGGAGYDLELLVSEIVGYGHACMSFDDFSRLVNTALPTVIQFIDGSYEGFGINESGPIDLPPRPGNPSVNPPRDRRYNWPEK